MSNLSIGDELSKVMAIVIKVLQIVAFLMLLIDVYYRYKGEPRYFAHALRFIFFIYGACCPWLLGGNENYAPDGYRGLGDKLFYNFFDQIYHGYFGSGYIDCFNHRLTVNNETYGFNYINVLYFEICGFILLKVCATVSASGIENNNKMANFWGSLKGMYLEFFAFPFAGWAVFFFKQHFVMIDLEDQGAIVKGRNDTVYYFSMLLAIYMTLEVAYSCYELIKGNFTMVEDIP
jgi:hypothetical protein